MNRYLLKRLAGLVPIFIGITLVTFIVIHLAPGSAVDNASALNPKMSAEAREKLASLYGLDKPLWAQYGSWVKRLVSLDLGRSFTDGEKVIDKIGRAMPVTVGINLLSLILIFLIGIPLGVYGAVHAGKPSERFLGTAALAAYSVPAFWLSLVLMSFFGVMLRWLPVSGLTSLTFDDMNAVEKAVDVARHLALPVLVSSLTGLAGLSRFMRSSLAAALKENYVRTARAKGLSEHAVIYKHALGNALLPVVTLVGLSVPGLLGGSVITESIFSIPGMGRLFFSAVSARDYPVIMGMLVLGAVLTLLGNLLADLLYARVDPRVRLE